MSSEGGNKTDSKLKCKSKQTAIVGHHFYHLIPRINHVSGLVSISNICEIIICCKLLCFPHISFVKSNIFTRCLLYITRQRLPPSSKCTCCSAGWPAGVSNVTCKTDVAARSDLSFRNGNKTQIYSLGKKIIIIFLTW